MKLPRVTGAAVNIPVREMGGREIAQLVRDARALDAIRRAEGEPVGPFPLSPEEPPESRAQRLESVADLARRMGDDARFRDVRQLPQYRQDFTRGMLARLSSTTFWSDVRAERRWIAFAALMVALVVWVWVG